MEITWKLQGNGWILIYQICVASGSLQLSFYVQHFFCLSYNWKLEIPWHKEKISSGSEPSVLRLGICGHPGIPAIPNPEIKCQQLAYWHLRWPYSIFTAWFRVFFGAHPSPPEPPVSPSPSNLLACCAKKTCISVPPILVKHSKISKTNGTHVSCYKHRWKLISSKSKLCIWLSMHILMVGTRSRRVDLEVHPTCPSKCPHHPNCVFIGLLGELLHLLLPATALQQLIKPCEKGKKNGEKTKSVI